MNYESYIGSSEPIRSDRETAKAILENMDAILYEITRAVESLQTAIYKGVANESNGVIAPNTPQPAQPTIKESMLKQRDDANRILNMLIEITNELW